MGGLALKETKASAEYFEILCVIFVHFELHVLLLLAILPSLVF